MISRIVICFIVMLLTGRVYAQIKYVPDNDETKRIIQGVLNAGYYAEKCDPGDSLCIMFNNLNKAAYEALKQPNVHVARIFNAVPKDTIDSYEFYNHFDKYFSIDTNIYTIYFFKWDEGEIIILGGANHNTDPLNPSYTQVTFTATNNRHFFNLSDVGNSTVIYPMSFDGTTMFVSDNQIKVIVNNKFVSSKDFFSRYSLFEINRRCRGIRKSDLVD